MRMHHLSQITLLSAMLLGCLTTGTAAANGGHFLVDDAAITDHGKCQLETWSSRTDGESFWVLQPACSTRNGWEIGLPVAYSFSNSEFISLGLEAKTILTEDIAGGALAVSIGTSMDLIEDKSTGGFINFPFSRLINDHWHLHVNAGVNYDRLASRWDATWGVATTYALTESIELIAETAGMGSDSPAFAIGTRYAFAQFEIDVSVARDTQLKDTVYTIGFNLAF